MYKLLSLSILLLLGSGTNSFRKEQQKAPKVLNAYQEKWPGLKKKLHESGVDTSAFRVFIRVFKAERNLELWVKNRDDKSYKLFQSYAICASSGTIGPKRRQGDGQVPEGFYKISVFNPYSNYYVSLGLDYPNKSDRILGGPGDLGGAIMIHGNCVTIGCMPLTDDKIKEVYVLAAEARNGGQQDIPVHVFPERLSAGNLNQLEAEYKSQPALISFWKNLKTGYDYFEEKKQLPSVAIASDGKYQFH